MNLSLTRPSSYVYCQPVAWRLRDELVVLVWRDQTPAEQQVTVISSLMIGKNTARMVYSFPFAGSCSDTFIFKLHHSAIWPVENLRLSLVKQTRVQAFMCLYHLVADGGMCSVFSMVWGMQSSRHLWLVNDAMSGTQMNFQKKSCESVLVASCNRGVFSPWLSEVYLVRSFSRVFRCSSVCPFRIEFNTSEDSLVVIDTDRLGIWHRWGDCFNIPVGMAGRAKKSQSDGHCIRV
ncbi:unnamed protein product [Enterobius vermicularis]|uniref:FBA_1 domain-containing protein n=1 Tax=Enterobius vermicularis TaxID=51028 RepID=A0A0N4VJE6_ENTVE|nr:unnamed protein product [Enterobius vermicularis]